MEMIISSIKSGTAIEGTRAQLTAEATAIVGAMLEKSPEVLLASLAPYADELEALNVDDFNHVVEALTVMAEFTKKRYKESKSYGD